MLSAKGKNEKRRQKEKNKRSRQEFIKKQKNK